MLQQTQTSTVLPYYRRFLRRFPDIQSLAEASEPEVMDAWSGLGYYSRARNLHQTARQIVKLHGSFPRNFSTVLGLPGIGRYTAGAICSIAFNQPYPVVDGNVRRVLARLTGIRKRIPENYFWDVMSILISRRAPSGFNQGMMELGALVCTPSQPRCPECPVRAFCRAHELGIETDIPTARRRRVFRRVGIAVLVLAQNRRILVTSSEEGSFIPGAWALPWRQIPDQISKEEIAANLCREIVQKDIGLEFRGNIRHSISDRQISGFCFYGNVSRISGVNASNEIRWEDPASITKLLTSSIFRKVLRMTGAGQR